MPNAQRRTPNVEFRCRMYGRMERCCPVRRERSFACLAIASCRAVVRPRRMEKAGGYVSVQFACSLPVAADNLPPEHSKKRVYRNECQMFRPTTTIYLCTTGFFDSSTLNV